MFIQAMPDDRDITKEEVLLFKEMMKQHKYAVSTYNNYVSIVNSFFKSAQMDGLFLKAIRVQDVSHIEDVLEPIEYKRLLRHAKEHGYMEIYMVMRVLAETGIRIAELKFFTVENINKSFVIEVENKGKHRDVIVRKELRHELKQYCRRYGIRSGYIFTGRENKKKPACEVTLWREMKKVAGLAKVKKIKVHAHSFRHLFAIRWASSGGDPLDLADILGHDSLNTTRKYTRTSNRQKKEKIESMHY